MARIEYRTPDSTVNDTNYSTSDFTDLQDDPTDPDGLFWDGNNDSNDTQCRCALPNVSGTPVTGTDLQELQIVVRRFDTLDGTAPEMRVEILQFGSIAVTLVTNEEIGTADGEFFSYLWDAADITAQANSIAIRIFGLASGGNPSNQRSVEVGSIRMIWLIDHPRRIRTTNS